MTRLTPYCSPDPGGVIWIRTIAYIDSTISWCLPIDSLLGLSESINCHWKLSLQMEVFLLEALSPDVFFLRLAHLGLQHSWPIGQQHKMWNPSSGGAGGGRHSYALNHDCYGRPPLQARPEMWQRRSRPLSEYDTRPPQYIHPHL